MIKFYLKGHKYEYEVNNVFRIFDLNSKIYFSNESEKIIDDNNDECSDNIEIFSSIYEHESILCASAVLYEQGKLRYQQLIRETDIELEKNDYKKLRKTLITKSLYYVLSKLYNTEAEYGFLTGIRPNKILTHAVSAGYSYDRIRSILKNTYEVKKEKIDLMFKVYDMQKKYINLEGNRDNYNIYIGIPFCPSKCIYCSFVSYVNYDKEMIDKYVETLCYEIDETIKMAMEKGLKLNTIYFGGGTPSILSCENINSIFSVIKKSYNLSDINEITFEAGRPDTITEEKLNCLKNNGVTRISINPQTMNDSTLKYISRKHTVEDIYRVYNMAKAFNFHSINMDLIIGLPGEDDNDVQNSISQVIKLNPENITIHALAYKKGSELLNSLKDLNKDYDIVERMYKITKEACINAEYKPYYMYRQKNIKANLENVGYCISGKESIYNIVIIEEIETILACGAGSVSKILKGNNRHERVQNYKNLSDYNNNVCKNIDEKRLILL